MEGEKYSSKEQDGQRRATIMGKTAGRSRLSSKDDGCVLIVDFSRKVKNEREEGWFI